MFIFLQYQTYASMSMSLSTSIFLNYSYFRYTAKIFIVWQIFYFYDFIIGSSLIQRYKCVKRWCSWHSSASELKHEWAASRPRIDTYLRYKSLVRKNLFWSFAIRQRWNANLLGTINSKEKVLLILELLKRL